MYGPYRRERDPAGLRLQWSHDGDDANVDLNAACLRSCLAIEGKEKGRNHANSGTGSIRVGSMGQRDRSVRRAEPHAGATATADAAR